jgi:pyruvate/2-oxoglutarate dehydrogenase complex dihydrolipoamide acyltransferase (E2) component
VKIGFPIAEIESDSAANGGQATATENKQATPDAPALSNQQSTATANPAAAPVAASAPSTNTSALDRISPLARKLAAEYNVDLGQISGTGEGGRVRKEDILAYVQRRDSGAGTATAAPPTPVSTPTSASAGEDEFITPTPMRRAIAEHMVRSKATSPHATTVVEVDMTNLAHWIEHNKATFKQQHGYSITYVPFVTKATCAALREVPTMNASWTADNRIQLRQHVNMGFAVSTDKGLLVPVLKDADQQSVAQIAQAINDLATRARANRLMPDDVQGGTFVVNNPGVFGTIFSVPIINQPNAGILSMDAVVKRPVVVEGDAIAIRSMMYLCLSFDHRINDGLEAARFLQAVRRHLEAYGGDINIH